MVSGQHRAGEVVKAPGAGLAPIALPAPLHIIVPVADHRTAVTAGAAHALWPAVLAHKGEALGVVHQAGKVDQVRCSHDGRSSSREPVGCSRSSHHSRCSPNALPKPTTPEHDKSHLFMFSSVRWASAVPKSTFRSRLTAHGVAIGGHP